jgi:hypothetical protein
VTHGYHRGPCTAAAAVAAVLVLSAAGGARASEPGETAPIAAPEGAEQRPAPADRVLTGTKMIIAGWVVLGSLHILSMVEGSIMGFAGAFGENGRSRYEEFQDFSPCVPLIGPFFQASYFTERGYEDDGFYAFLLIFDGLLQLGALATAVAGHVILRKGLRSGSGERSAGSRIAERRLLVPSLLHVPGGGGLGLAGTF